MGERQWTAVRWEGTDPAENLAMEEYAFDRLPLDRDYVILWQNRPSVIIGKHQNALEEINGEYVRRKQLPVVRRLSGGGAVYHDLGNLNFTFLARTQGFSGEWAQILEPVLGACQALGVRASLSGRNDLTGPDGRKFSGNARYERDGRLMHHGTLLISADLGAMEEALRVSRDKMRSRGVASVRARVGNLREYAPGITVESFRETLLEALSGGRELESCCWSAQDREEIRRRAEARYRRWEWNYGNFPACSMVRERRIEGCGQVKVGLELLAGCVTECHFQGDFLGSAPVEQLEGLLEGCRLEEAALRKRLEQVPVDDYIRGMDAGLLTELLLGGIVQ